jgi:phosphatidate cytidylyltransferase
MVKRVVTAILCLPPLIFLVGFGGWPLGLVCMLLSLAGLYEIYNALGNKNIYVHGAGYVFTVVYYLLILYWGVGYWLLVVMTLFIITVQTLLVVFFPKVPLHEFITTVYGFFYVSLLLSFVYLIREHEFGRYYVWLIFTGSFGCDTFAYMVGMNFGKHKLTKTPSPKKSVEGIFGGIIGAALIGLLYGYCVMRFGNDPPDNIMFAAAFISFCGGVFSIIGDMSASAIKRYTDIKDFGRLFPGHGGVLDRFDSVLVTAPIVYLVMMWILRY